MFDIKSSKTLEALKYSIQVVALDCTSCGSCAKVCHAPDKAMIMQPLDQHKDDAEKFEQKAVAFSRLQS